MTELRVVKELGYIPDDSSAADGTFSVPNSDEGDEAIRAKKVATWECS